MISSFTATNKMLTILFVVLFSLNLYIVNCEIMENMDSMNNKDSMIVPSNTDTSNENDQTLWELADSGEHGATGEMHNLDYLTKLKLLELFLNEIKRKEQLLQQLTKSRNQNFISNSKRSFLRAMKDSDRKRPGWELAYGRRKRSIV